MSSVESNDALNKAHSGVSQMAFENFMQNFTDRYGEEEVAVAEGNIVWQRMPDFMKDTYVPVDRNEDMSCCPKKKRRSCPKPRCAPKRQPACKPRCAAPMPRCAAKPRCPMKSSCPQKPKPRCAMKPRCAAKPRCASKPKPRCAPKPSSCKPRCQKPGPITNNAYLNFLRVFRKKNCGLHPQDMVRKAAKAWCALPECDKKRYRRQACKVTTNERHKRRRECTM